MRIYFIIIFTIILILPIIIDIVMLRRKGVQYELNSSEHKEFMKRFKKKWAKWYIGVLCVAFIVAFALSYFGNGLF